MGQHAAAKISGSRLTTLAEHKHQELAAANNGNAVNEGADYSYVNPTATTRLGNWTVGSPATVH